MSVFVFSVQIPAEEPEKRNKFDLPVKQVINYNFAKRDKITDRQLSITMQGQIDFARSRPFISPMLAN
jgi:hypothetical protein